MVRVLRVLHVVRHSNARSSGRGYTLWRVLQVSARRVGVGVRNVCLRVRVCVLWLHWLVAVGVLIGSWLVCHSGAGSLVVFVRISPVALG